MSALPRPPAESPTARTRDRAHARRYLLDGAAARFVKVSGVAIILAILAILAVLVAVAGPLVLPPRAHAQATVPLPAGAAPLALASEEYREMAVVAFPDGLKVMSLKTGAFVGAGFVPPDGTTIASAWLGTEGLAALGLSDGRVLPVRYAFSSTFEGGKRSLTPELTPGEPIRAETTGMLRTVQGPEGPVVLALPGPRSVALVRVKETVGLIGGGSREESRATLPLHLSSDVTALAIDGRAADVFVGTAGGEIVRVDLRDAEAPTVPESVLAASRPGAAITLLGFLNGDRTLVAGDAAGGVATWQLLEDGRGGRRLVLIHRFEAHGAPITSFSASRRDKGFVTGDARGGVKVHYGTTGRTLLTLPGASGRVEALHFAPKADGVVAAAGGRVHHWALHNPHPEITWGSLFGKVWYEGYPGPEYVWQSTGGTDDFEAKFSLVPLIYGTLKGTFYALLVAVPLALLGALYTAQFMHPGLKSIVKPTVEVMAALPSVVLGFLAGLWLAPTVERIVPGLALFCLVGPVLVLLAALAWRLVPAATRAKVRPGVELSLLVPVVLLAFGLSTALGGALERSLLHGDYRTWLAAAMGSTYDQRNSLVVGLAMGFAVIPIIFTVAEDSIASVPPGLTAGSLALGATRWQTALRTVLPTASPGVFSAVMIGFGRAVGETMIVLMATGNTPVMDASIWSGFRALSANIAVELPEAPEGGTLFRVLFVAALLLYALTFTANTAAELVRLRLRRKYRTFE